MGKCSNMQLKVPNIWHAGHTALAGHVSDNIISCGRLGEKIRIAAERGDQDASFEPIYKFLALPKKSGNLPNVRCRTNFFVFGAQLFPNRWDAGKFSDQNEALDLLFQHIYSLLGHIGWESAQICGKRSQMYGMLAI
jgi:hypothetical protein